SGEIILASMRHATRTVLAREIPAEDLLAAIGGPGLERVMHALDPTRAEELVRAYREHNKPLHAQLRCCRGMDGALVRLQAEGRRLGLVTAKPRRTVKLAFRALPLREVFDVVVCGDDTERDKPDPEPILLALQRLGARAQTAAYVGDSPFDVAAARAAGVYAVAVGWGGMHSDERLRAEQPDAFVRTPAELLACV
ncbi:MAG: HAD family hydrolase, partial [Actinobacteria bacterium]